MAGNDRESGAAPVQVRGTVLTVRRVDAYVAMTVVAPAIATRFRPGQFVAIAVGGPQSGMLGRRSFSIHDVRPDHGGTVSSCSCPASLARSGWRTAAPATSLTWSVHWPPVPRAPRPGLVPAPRRRPWRRAAVRAGLTAGRARLARGLPARRRERRPGLRRADRPADRALGGHRHHRRLPRVTRLGGGHAADRRAAGAHRRHLRVGARGRAEVGVRARRPGTASRSRPSCRSRR